jgi:mono/diheme cytochrome c family protein
VKKILKVIASVVVVLLVVGLGGFLWAKSKAASILGRTIVVHEVDFPVPFPLDSAEVAAEGLAPEQAAAAALERAVERGRHMVESRYVCVECHGKDFGGGVMVNDPMIGRLLGPNITAGPGGRTAAYTPSDWDRIVRHGVRPDGHPAAMPAEDFQRMADRELSDIIAYIRSKPAVDATVPPVSLGPLGTVLLATAALPLSVDIIGVHDAPHMALPPVTEASADFGRHLAAVCTGCHKADLSGGKIPGGDPSWAPAANLTPHADGMQEWTKEQFSRTMREGVRRDGTPVLAPMDMVSGYTRQMTDTELEALWLFLRSLPAVAGSS